MISAELDQLESDGFRIEDRCLDANATDGLISHLNGIAEGGFESSARVRRGVIFARRNLLSTNFVQQFIRIDAVQSLVSGVDMVRSNHGPLIMEVNSSPGLEGIEGASGIDIAGRIIEFLEQNASYGKTETKGVG